PSDDGRCAAGPPKMADPVSLIPPGAKAGSGRGLGAVGGPGLHETVALDARVAIAMRSGCPAAGPLPSDPSAPTGQVVSVLTLGELARLLKRPAEIRINGLAFYPPSKEVGPQEFAIRGRVLGEAADEPQFAGERAERIVDQIPD